MWIFSPTGKKAYLEYLRNLTPQAVLLSLFLVVGVTTQRNYENGDIWWTGWISCTLLMLMWLLSFYANGAILYEGILEGRFGISRIRRYQGHLKRSSLRLVWTTLVYCLRRHRLMTLEITLFIMVTSMAAIITLLAGFSAARTLLSAIKGG
ncbi:hypothetical protein [Pseudomonas sp. GV085]|uniref:hypothetical protein n=1 Tax=Pseudomonas sp. GV085 TaxID=2135756 RepID=UPI000D37D18C|nr:hypothetical protein [Pseudomonas sp. GV085]